jgi:hypothetical protein
MMKIFIVCAMIVMSVAAVPSSSYTRGSEIAMSETRICDRQSTKQLCNTTYHYPYVPGTICLISYQLFIKDIANRFCRFVADCEREVKYDSMSVWANYDWDRRTSYAFWAVRPCDFWSKNTVCPYLSSERSCSVFYYITCENCKDTK